MPQAHAITRFFTLTFAFTFCLQVPGVLARKGLMPGDPAMYLPFAMLGIFGPLVAASYLTWQERGRAGLAELYGSLVNFRVSLRWVLLGFVLPPLLLSGILYLLNAVGRQGPWHYVPAVPQLIAGIVISIAEETGWRGYALPRLSAKYGAVFGSGILGVLWMLWHIPMFVAAGVATSLYLVMLLLLVGGSLFFTFLYRKTQGSLFVMVLAHLATHLNNSHAALPADALPAVVHAVVYAALGFACMRGAAFERGARQPAGERLARV
jgi:membrane protease YdiL (CAAX protease family)